MEREAFLLDLGISSAWTQRHLSVELAPPLDDRAKERLRALVQRKLPEASAKVLFDLIAAFPSSWGAEYGKILKEECLGSPGLREWHEKEEQHRTAKTKYIPTVRILAYGPPQQESMLSGALRERIPHARVAFSPWPGDLPPPKTIQGSDAAVCLVEPGADQERFVERVVAECPYFPVFVVGDLPAKFRSVSKPTLVYHLGPVDFKSIAEAVDQVIQVIWWRSSSQIDLPGIVVSREGMIVQANNAALDRFGTSLLGRPYRSAVEDASEQTLPAGHPIQDCFASGSGVSRYHEFPSSGKGAYLICMPILGLADDKVRAVAVLVREMSRWGQIFRAVKILHHAETLEQLYQAVVDQVRELGYERARLKEYDSRQDILYGRASVGFEPLLARNYKENFCIQVKDDPLSREALDREWPLLFVPAANEASVHGISLFISYSTRHHEAALDKRDVTRWIDAPLLVPTVTDTGAPTTQKWGILTVDRGKKSDLLDAHDVIDICLFSTVAAAALGALKARLSRPTGQSVAFPGYAELLAKVAPLVSPPGTEHPDGFRRYGELMVMAMAMQEHLLHDRRHLNVFQRYSQQLTKLLRQAPEEKIRQEVMDLLLKMYLEITGAKVAYYRELRGESLVLASEPVWRGEKPADVEIPKEFHKGDRFSTLLLEKIESGGHLKGDATAEPFFHNDMTERIREALQQAGPGRWSAAELKLLRYPSAVYIPLVVHGQLRGTVIALGDRPNAFPADINLSVQQFIHSAALWFELGELLDGRLWLNRKVANVHAILPRLANAPESDHDESFFAGLAALLSAGDGLGWNRVMVFSCEGSQSNTAELVYALGGLGDKPRHIRRQQATSRHFDNRLWKLVEERMGDPTPHGDDGNGNDCVDPLYERCVQEPRQSSTPIFIPYGLNVPKESISVCEVGNEVATSHPLRWMLDQTDSLIPRTVPFALRREGWPQVMNKTYPGMFCADVTYAFPLWGDLGQERVPLGVVLVDMAYEPRMAYEPGKQVYEIVSATRVLLDRAVSLLVSRILGQRMQVSLGAFLDSPNSHLARRINLDLVWGEFSSNLTRLLEILKSPELKGQLNRADLFSQADAVNALWPKLVRNTKPYIRTLAAMLDRINSPEGCHATPDFSRLCADFYQI